MWDLREAAEALEAKLIRPMAPFVVSGATCDSRRVQPGDVFIALTGSRANGHDFLGEAFARGAVGAVVSRDPGAGSNLVLVSDVATTLRELASWRRTAIEAPIVGVTGSFGKTTMKELVAAALSARYRTYRAPENYNTEIGVPLAILSIPDDVEAAVFEMGMTARGEIRELSDLLQPWAGVITSIGPAHLGSLGSIEAIADAKWELAESLPEEGILALGWDYPELRVRADRYPGLCLRFGSTADADFHPRNVATDRPEGVAFDAVTPAGAFSVQLKLLGEHVPVLACGAIALAWGMGVPEKSAAQALAHVEPVPHRLHLRPAPFGWLLDDCYNANPLSMQAALRAAVSLKVPVAQRVVLFGDMLDLGLDEEQFHAQAIREARDAGVDALFCFGPRSTAAYAAWNGPGTAEATDLDRLLSEVRRTIWSAPTLLLVKGSRGMALERAIEGLINYAPAAGPTD
ncbi:MAG: UDP-N-acetylmuramoyl-tripeptide--D-alanyl-D-alanine ligase [Candidatus Bipolaricaulis sibiricus]|uniref:UDP-N-acetylmuramoyl-tripeptide--D-alanyl-D-alanine ligase n=1 Tax=Bipolaricaulis sibiricus TaxID=2501609 RepID=A0A410FUG0_BIPS1|nr:MAG: UDP-N-acetylmuramoyl-tripeptide--D-alanyl-D-alanine ligase [Candidatus Bipolaricaulis sibiricus]